MRKKKILDEYSKKNLKKFFKILLKYKKKWLFIGILLLIVTLMKLPMPLLTGYIIDNIIIKNNSNLLNLICAGLVIITLIYLLFNYFKDYLLFLVQKVVTIRIRMILSEKIQCLPLNDIKKKETGYLLARILNDSSSLNGLFFQTFFNIIHSIITLIVGIVVIFSINWKLSILSLSILPFFVISNFLFLGKIKYWDDRVKEKNAVITKFLSESLSALKLTKLFSLYKTENIKLLKNLKEELEFSKKSFKFGYTVTLFSGFFSALGPLMVVWYGGHEIIEGNLSIGQFIAFSALLGFLYNPTISMLNIHVNFQRSLVSLNRIFDILNMPSEKNNHHVNEKYIPSNYQIEFRDVSFSYNGVENVLNNINLKIQNNEKIAILGPIGSGKSTLINLLPLFYEPNKGSIFIGNRNIKEIPLNQLRRYIGFVSQEEFLFSTTIYNNIRIGNLKANNDEVIMAAKIANAYQFIKSLPLEFDTLVGEGGEFLSGGQRQLICLSRVILKNPPILILDEPTSAIDSQNEKLIQNSLKSFSQGKISIIISHRLSSILNVDRIFIIENGRIFCTGTHDELIKKSEFYQKLWKN